MNANDPCGPPPSYEEAQNAAPYPAYPPQTGVNPEPPKPYGFPPAGANQPYPVQQGYPQQYPYGAPTYPNQGAYPAVTPGQTYNYPPAVASYNHQGVVVQPGLSLANSFGPDQMSTSLASGWNIARPTQMAQYQRRRKIVFTLAAVIFAFIFLSIIIRVIV